jgi:hypothetical protein
MSRYDGLMNGGNVTTSRYDGRMYGGNVTMSRCYGPVHGGDKSVTAYGGTTFRDDIPADPGSCPNSVLAFRGCSGVL